MALASKQEVTHQHIAQTSPQIQNIVVLPCKICYHKHSTYVSITISPSWTNLVHTCEWQYVEHPDSAIQWNNFHRHRTLQPISRPTRGSLLLWTTQSHWERTPSMYHCVAPQLGFVHAITHNWRVERVVNNDSHWMLRQHAEIKDNWNLNTSGKPRFVRRAQNSRNAFKYFPCPRGRSGTASMPSPTTLWRGLCPVARR